MPIVVACARGHVTKFDNRLAGCTVRCPECDEMLQVPERSAATSGAETPRSRPKGLWGVMQKSTEPATEPPAARPPAARPPAARPPAAGEEAPPKVRREEERKEEAPRAARSKSMWEKMPASPPEPEGGPLSIHEVPAKVDKRLRAAPPPEPPRPAPADSEEQSLAEPEQKSPALRGRPDKRLRAVPPPAPPRPGPEDIVELARANDDQDSPPTEPAQKPPAPRVAPIPSVRPAPPPAAAAPPVPGAALPRSWKAVGSVVLGAVALPFTVLAVIPSIWSSMPAGLLGISALLLGLTANSEIRRSRGRLGGNGLATTGVALGIAGALLGPMVLSQLGIWESIARRETQEHLEFIGRGLAGYERVNEMYPPGGSFAQTPDGKVEPRHGWMTSILPFLGYQTLYNSIDLQRPYDAPENLGPMHTTIPEYLAAGGNPTPIGNLGVSHFAGLGGEISLPDGTFGHVGIFGENSEVMRDDITGGLSETLIVGEVAGNYPAWGSPRNWRQIGQGLNRSAEGFGNAAQTGAMFLAADGSVRFFSNRIDPEILRRMSQRDRSPPEEPAAPETPEMPAPSAE